MATFAVFWALAVSCVIAFFVGAAGALFGFDFWPVFVVCAVALGVPAMWFNWAMTRVFR